MTTYEFLRWISCKVTQVMSSQGLGSDSEHCSRHIQLYLPGMAPALPTWNGSNFTYLEWLQLYLLEWLPTLSTWNQWLNYHTLMLKIVLFDQRPQRKLSDWGMEAHKLQWFILLNGEAIRPRGLLFFILVGTLLYEFLHDIWLFNRHIQLYNRFVRWFNKNYTGAYHKKFWSNCGINDYIQGVLVPLLYITTYRVSLCPCCILLHTGCPCAPVVYYYIQGVLVPLLYITTYRVSLCPCCILLHTGCPCAPVVYYYIQGVLVPLLYITTYRVSLCPCCILLHTGCPCAPVVYYYIQGVLVPLLYITTYRVSLCPCCNNKMSDWRAWRAPLLQLYLVFAKIRNLTKYIFNFWKIQHHPLLEEHDGHACGVLLIAFKCQIWSFLNLTVVMISLPNKLYALLDQIAGQVFKTMFKWEMSKIWLFGLICKITVSAFC